MPPGRTLPADEGQAGQGEGITATAHKLARVIHALIASGRGYDEAFRKKPGVEQKRLNNLRIQAKLLEFRSVPIQQVTTS